MFGISSCFLLTPHHCWDRVAYSPELIVCFSARAIPHFYSDHRYERVQHLHHNSIASQLLATPHNQPSTQQHVLQVQWWARQSHTLVSVSSSAVVIQSYTHIYLPCTYDLKHGNFGYDMEHRRNKLQKFNIRFSLGCSQRTNQYNSKATLMPGEALAYYLLSEWVAVGRPSQPGQYRLIATK